jgi:PAS domain S-box-containing protein
VRSVPNLPVTVVAWVDRDVALAPYRSRVRGDAQFLVGWLLAAGVGVWLLWRSGKSRAEAQAAEERARAAEVFESVNDAVFVTTLDGSILDVNEKAVDTYGWSRDEFRRMRGEDVRSPIEGPTVAERLAEARQRGVMVYETRHRRRDGTSFPVEISFRRLDRAGGDIFIAVARNITERDAATRRIRRLNQLLRTLFEVDALIVRERDRDRLMQGICSIVAEHGGYALVWVGVPDVANERLVVAAADGVARDYVDGLEVSTKDVPEGRGPSGVAFRERRVVLTRDLASAPSMGPWRDRLLRFGFNASAAVPIVSGDKAVGVLTVCSVDDEAFDADTLPLLEQLGRDLGFAFDSIESEAQLRGFLDTGAVAMAVFELRGDDGVLVLANRRFAEFAGAAVDRLVGKTGREAGMPEELRRSWTDAFRRAVQYRESVSMEFPWKTPQGDFWLQGTLTPLEQASAPHPRAAFAAIDVTARHEAEEKLRQAQKMEAIGRLAGGVAHDFNNLLTAILGYTELIQLSLDAADPRALHLAEVRRAGERAADLTRQLLAFGRKQVLRPAVLDVNAIVHDVERLLSRLIGEHITLELELQPDLRSVLADRGQFEQVLVNLAVNARDAMPSGGRLSISTGCDDFEVWLRVRDSGTGIAPEHVQHIFEPFFTTKEKDKGTGLGLATVYGIVEQSGGRITVETELGRGTAFTIRFPAAHRKPAETSPAPARKSAANVPEATVLLVEDEDAVRRFVAAALRSAGLRVVEASSPAEAIQLLRAGSVPFDVLLSDVVMPGMNGFDLAVEARRILPNLRAIFMSGYAEGALAQGARPGPDDVVLMKPFSTDVLVEHLRRRLQDA